VFKKIKYLLISVATLLCGESAHAQTSSYGELQAAYLFNFAKYIKWPGESKVFAIGIFGEADIMDDLESTLKDKKVGGRTIELKIITSMEHLSEFQIVYLPESASKDLNRLKEAVIGKSILIVTEEDLIKKGAAISFIVEDDRLRFKLKRSVLAEAGLVVSEGLLRLAILL
jgi:hypothetical protein